MTRLNQSDYQSKLMNQRPFCLLQTSTDPNLYETVAERHDESQCFIRRIVYFCPLVANLIGNPLEITSPLLAIRVLDREEGF